MELDDLKPAWQALDRSLERQSTLNLAIFRAGRVDRLRGSLRPLFWGQLAQMLLLGLPFIALATLLWASQPQHAAVIVAGVIVHAYGVLAIVSAGIVLGQIGRIDHAEPVLEIQKRLARLRKLYIRSGMVVGLPWWFLWIAILQVLAGLRGVDLAHTAPSMLWIGYGLGAAGLLGTAWLHRWARRPERAALGAKMDASLSGGSLRKAQAQLDELLRFERT